MIPKLICWLFGHIRQRFRFTGYDKDIGWKWGAYGVIDKLDECPRCGKTFKEKG